MYLLYCDETNIQERSGDFLIYGGLYVDSAQALELSQAIDCIRRNALVPRDFQLKFNPGPGDLPHEAFIALKQALIKKAIAHGVKLIVYVVLHDIANNPDEARLYGINTVCHHFHYHLNRLGSVGLVLIDRFTDSGNRIDAHLREKFSIGLRSMPYSPEIRLERIVGFHYSAIGQSHFPSLIDVILGTLRFALNAHTRNEVEKLVTAQRLLRLISPLFYRREDFTGISETSFCFSPKIVEAETYRAKYQALKDFLADAGVQTEQQITNQRPY